MIAQDGSGSEMCIDIGHEYRAVILSRVKENWNRLKTITGSYMSPGGGAWSGLEAIMELKDVQLPHVILEVARA
jgi:hypothetical protein